MSRRLRDLRPGILQRRAESGLGVACADAQPDGVPCSTTACDCESCERGAAAVVTAVPPPLPDRSTLTPP